jgi:threonine/homoserine/homoserine lactone efflux protein
MTIHTVAIFMVALFLNAATPGPSVAALVSRVISKGWRDVLPFVAAMWVGEVLWLLMALAGLTTLAQTFSTGFLILKWLGVAYLGWLAVRMWRQAGEPSGEDLPKSSTPASMFATGMALTLGNPKIMVFYMALLPSIVEIPSLAARDWVVLAAATLATLAAIDLAWTFAAHRAQRLLRTPRAVRIANKVGAVTLGGAAATIAARS